MPTLGEELAILYSLGSTSVAAGSVTPAQLSFDPATQAELDAVDVRAPRTVTGSTTLTLTDRLTVVNSSSPANVTVPAAATVSYPVGIVQRIINRGSAVVSILDAATTTTFTTLATNQTLTLQNIAADYWVVV